MRSAISLCLVLCLYFIAVQSQQRGYRDPCHGKSCGRYGCCVRRDPYYVSRRIFFRRAICACDEHYYYHRRDDVCRHGCYQNTCHRYATCYPKRQGARYPGFAQWNIYLNNYYYCRCNRGYVGNGRQCRRVDPCRNNNCHQYATCHPKPIGSTDYYNYATYPGYVNNAYYCRCRRNYYGHGRQCTHGCFRNTCNRYATCRPKPLGLGYPNSRRNPIYRNNYYYCQCNRGYQGNGRRCISRDPCRSANCHQYATCHRKPYGSTSYYNYNTYTGYVNNDYYCRCRPNYYGNGRRCSRCSACHRHARCIPKPCGSRSYPGYGNTRFYVPLCYYCQCRRPYSGNGRLCLHIG